MNSLIILTKRPATQEITENWKISGNFIRYHFFPPLCRDVGGLWGLSANASAGWYLLSRRCKPRTHSQIHTRRCPSLPRHSAPLYIKQDFSVSRVYQTISEDFFDSASLLSPFHFLSWFLQHDLLLSCPSSFLKASSPSFLTTWAKIAFLTACNKQFFSDLCLTRHLTPLLLDMKKKRNLCYL